LGTAPQSCNPGHRFRSSYHRCRGKFRGESRLCSAESRNDDYICLSVDCRDFLNSLNSDRPSASRQGTQGHGRMTLLTMLAGVSRESVWRNPSCPGRRQCRLLSQRPPPPQNPQ